MPMSHFRAMCEAVELIGKMLGRYKFQNVCVLKKLTTNAK